MHIDMKRLFSIVLAAGLLMSVCSFAQTRVNFYRVSSPGEYLAESHTQGLLGVSDDADRDASMGLLYMRGEVVPQYLIVADQSVRVADGCTEARFLVPEMKADGSLSDRLAFVDGKLYDTGVLEVQGAIYNLKSDEEGEGAPCPVLFSFRLADNAGDNFLIESTDGQWLAIKDGQPVIIQTTLAKAVTGDAEVFNIQVAKTPPAKQAIPQTVGLEPVVAMVSAEQGLVRIQGATGKPVMITNSLGQVLAKATLQSDNQTMAVPAGVAFVSVDGKPAQKVLVK